MGSESDISMSYVTGRDTMFNGRSVGVLLSGRYDRIFKEIVNCEWANKSTGNVNSPTGYFAIIEVPEHEGEREELWSAVFDRKSGPEEPIEPGWYFTREDSNGIIWVFKMNNEIVARGVYNELEIAYDEWLDDEWLDDEWLDDESTSHTPVADKEVNEVVTTINLDAASLCLARQELRNLVERAENGTLGDHWETGALSQILNSLGLSK